MIVCPGENVTFRCTTTGGALLWETSTVVLNELFNSPDKQHAELGIFDLTLTGFVNTTVLEVNSTATTTNVQPSVDGVTLTCSVTTGFVRDQATLSIAG